MKIVLASNNKDKLAEIRRILPSPEYEVISQREAGADIEAEENGSSFAENAAIKARAAYNILKMPVIADDSGLCVDFLNGAPGIYSARYAEKGRRCEKLLNELEGVPDEKRGAEFVCAVCYIDGSGNEHIFEGRCRGKIAFERKGSGGFGYDPIFIYNGRTFAEIPAEEKKKISHRALALEQLKTFLDNAHGEL